MTQAEILKNLGIKTLNAMQQSAVKLISENQSDIVILSPTGTGKTLAYLLPLVAKIDINRPTLQIVVIVPSRELAQQSVAVLKSMRCGVRGLACYGGRMAMDEHRQIREVMPQIVFATPGRLLDHLNKGNLHPEDVRYIVIDEFDKCLEMGFTEEMQSILNCFPSRTIHRILLSATNAELIPRFLGATDTKYLDFLNDKTIDKRVTFEYCKSQQRDKLETLLKLLIQLGDSSSIVFVNHRDAAERIACFLKEQGFVVSIYHGGLDQRQREDAIFRFSNGSTSVLVATDIASRGLDIEVVGSIIHYHLPDTKEIFLHRIGRTARWDATGKSIFLLGPEETIPEFVEIEHEEISIDSNNTIIPQPKMSTIYIGKGKKDKLSRGDVLGFLCKKGGLDKTEVGNIDVRERYCYVAVSRKEVKKLLQKVAGEKIKGIKTIIEPLE